MQYWIVQYYIIVSHTCGNSFHDLNENKKNKKHKKNKTTKHSKLKGPPPLREGPNCILLDPRNHLHVSKLCLFSDELVLRGGEDGKFDPVRRGPVHLVHASG